MPNHQWKLHWALNHQTINRNKEEKSCWSYRFLRLTASFFDYKYFNCMPGSAKRNWISYLMPVLEFYFKVYFKPAPCTSIMWDDSVNERECFSSAKTLKPKNNCNQMQHIHDISSSKWCFLCLLLFRLLMFKATLMKIFMLAIAQMTTCVWKVHTGFNQLYRVF